VAKGQTNKEVAATLVISPSTVRQHLENIFEKFGVHTRGAAIAVALDRGARLAAGPGVSAANPRDGRYWAVHKPHRNGR
jgi:hypothetical protein